MKNVSIKEFKPTILFLVKFIGIYLVANLLYGFYVTAYEPAPDPATRVVSGQTAIALSACGWPTITRDNDRKPTTELVYDDNSVIAVYEGCNGLNVMIIFVAFLIAFGPLVKNLLWFIPLGIGILHGVNLARIGLLFWVSLYLPDFMYFTHKYFFTAILYVVVFVLWIAWVRKVSSAKKASH